MMRYCCPTPEIASIDTAYRKALWAVLVINAIMFIVEIISGIAAGSVSLQADALDFLGDATNYGIALYVLSKSVRMKAYSSLTKSLTMFIFGLWVLSQAIYKVINGTPPEVNIMGIVGFLALVANIFCFYLLSRHSREDSNRKSVWLCSRNDAIGNIAVLLAALITYYTSSHWPDLMVALIISGLAITSALQIFKQVIKEL